ncbi:hypothetical protein PanWU01x14_013110, partial [Parasponia andersonii]
ATQAAASGDDGWRSFGVAPGVDAGWWRGRTTPGGGSAADLGNSAERERERRGRERELGGGRREKRERGEIKVCTWPPFIGLCNFLKIAHKSPKFQISINPVPQNLQFSPSEQNFCKLVPTIFYPENW